jgi:hypothetical protein
MNTIDIIPRQARDKHTEKLRKHAFFAGSSRKGAEGEKEKSSCLHFPDKIQNNHVLPRQAQDKRKESLAKSVFTHTHTHT